MAAWRTCACFAGFSTYYWVLLQWVAFVGLFSDAADLRWQSRSSFIFGPKKVCYEHIGCFNASHPFDNAMDYLPESPDAVHVTFNLRTRASPETDKVLDEKDPSTVSAANFDPEKPTKFIIHGYDSSGKAAWVLNMSRIFLQKEDCNVITVDWHDGADKFYPQAVANTRMTAAVTANLIRVLFSQFGLDLRNIHLIGHSLGSHICGYIGHRVPGIGRITGLDPAGPLFENVDPIVRLDPSDGIFVDVIHSDGVPLVDLGFGTQQQLGHVDFYPNGGTLQPGCPPHQYIKVAEEVLTLDFKDIVHTVDCSHDRALLLFTDTIVAEGCQFLGYPCSSKEKFYGGQCMTCPPGGCPLMGYRAPKVPAKPGKYYLKTNSQSPFCKPE